MKSSDSSGTFAIKQDASIDFDAHPVKAIRSPVSPLLNRGATRIVVQAPEGRV
jgi:hypothetical protein